MSKFTFKTWKFCLIFISLITCILPVKSDETAFHRIFEIQKKHALKGSKLAQYKLGTYYEFGISVKPNVSEAKKWYKKSADKNNKRAINRLKYLQVKSNGYNSSIDNVWVNKIADESKRGNIHSTIILGQLYHFGLGVKKDLPNALELLEVASVQGYTEIDFEIDEIVKSINKINLDKRVVVRSVAVKKVKNLQVKVDKPKIVVKNKTTKKFSTKKSDADIKRLKRKRYEIMLHKQYREQLILQQQQQWSESEEWTEEDEEEEDTNEN